MVKDKFVQIGHSLFG